MLMVAYASELIKIAEAEVGYLEKKSNAQLDDKTANAGNKNFTKYARDLDVVPDFYNGKKQGAAWCDVFVDWCFFKAFGTDKAKELLCQPSKSLGAGCGFSMNYYKQKGRFSSVPAVGDQIFFKNKSGGICHTGIVYALDGGYIYTIEGNTAGASGVVANGGGVCKKKYARSYSMVAGYGHPAYDAEVAPVPVPSTSSGQNRAVLAWQRAAIADGFKFPKFGADGYWGAECVAVAKKAIVKKRLVYSNKNLTKIVQAAVGVTADGKCGRNTDAAIRAYQRSHGLTADGAVGINTWKKILGV